MNNMTYNFSINDFEGPLDLLLHLVKESKMNIYDIDIHLIIEEYLEFIKSLQDNNIDVASEYLVMSAELIHLKSRLLINRIDEEDKEPVEDEYEINSEEDLRNKLIEYEKYKEVTKNLHQLEENRNEFYTKLPEPLKEYLPEERLEKGELSITDIFSAYEKFLNRQKLSEPLNTKITKRNISVPDKINYIRNIIKDKGHVNFFDLFTDNSKETIIVTFLSILEMSKNDEILITQKDNFSEIMIEKRM
jgi:segregation and condensation protein A